MLDRFAIPVNAMQKRLSEQTIHPLSPADAALLTRLTEACAAISRRLQVATRANQYIDAVQRAAVDASARGLRSALAGARQEFMTGFFNLTPVPAKGKAPALAKQQVALRALAASQPYLPSSLFGGTFHHALQTLRGQQLAYQALVAGVREIGGKTPVSMSLHPTTQSSPPAAHPTRGSSRGSRKSRPSRDKGGKRKGGYKASQGGRSTPAATTTNQSTPNPSPSPAPRGRGGGRGRGSYRGAGRGTGRGRGAKEST